MYIVKKQQEVVKTKRPISNVLERQISVDFIVNERAFPASSKCIPIEDASSKAKIMHVRAEVFFRFKHY